MKVIIINGSPRQDSNTLVGLKEVQKALEEEGIETEIIDIGNQDIRGCIACRSCHESGKCVFDDIVNEVALKFEQADGIVVGSPVYYANINATVLAFLQRLFYSSRFDKTMKVGAAVVCARRSGTTASLDEINRFFTISGMPVVSSTYWNNIYGNMPKEALHDEEGIQTMRNLGKNMAFLIKAIALGKKEYGLPLKEKDARTNFIK